VPGWKTPDWRSWRGAARACLFHRSKCLASRVRPTAFSVQGPERLRRRWERDTQLGAPPRSVPMLRSTSEAGSASRTSRCPPPDRGIKLDRQRGACLLVDVIIIRHEAAVQRNGYGFETGPRASATPLTYYPGGNARRRGCVRRDQVRRGIAVAARHHFFSCVRRMPSCHFPSTPQCWVHRWSSMSPIAFPSSTSGRPAASRPFTIASARKKLLGRSSSRLGPQFTAQDKAACVMEERLAGRRAMWVGWPAFKSTPTHETFRLDHETFLRMEPPTGPLPVVAKLRAEGTEHHCSANIGGACRNKRLRCAINEGAPSSPWKRRKVL